MKKIFAIALVSILFTNNLLAHEGMWIPSLLKSLEDDMQARGLKLSAEDIYSINKSSLKDAIVHFGGGCTAEVVSSEGLIFTNHHCGYSQINAHSTLEHNYLVDGFWAMSKAEELPNKNLTASFIVRIEDVTAKLNKVVNNDMSESEAHKAQVAESKHLIAQATEGNGYNAVIKPFDYGNSYYMIVTQTFEDVRLVGAPPSEIGKFGGDTDNWVWPRHTGDFSVFRIYAGKDNKPAKYSKENIPYQPKKVLPVSMEELKEDDFTMVFGFPGRTFQHYTSFALDDELHKVIPIRLKMREQSLAVIDGAMKANETTFLQYASKQSRISNAYKKWIGQRLGLMKKDALKKKQAFETEFAKRVTDSYKDVLPALKSSQEEFSPYQVGQILFWELWYYGPECIRYSYSYDDLFGKDFNSTLASRKSGVEGFFKNYDEAVDKQVFVKLLRTYLLNLSEDLRPEIFNEIKEKYHNDYQEYADFIFKKSAFTHPERLNKLLAGSESAIKKKVLKDPLYLLAKQIMQNNSTKIAPKYRYYQDQIDVLMKRFVAAKFEFFPEKDYWADANSTLRLTYGKAEGTNPRDGMRYSWYTTLDGIIEKNNTGEDDFNIPIRLRQLAEKKDYGQYAVNGELRVCFLGSNHTTGGNSGSPALNAEGHLIGINFDRSWESTMSDLMFDPDICRNIMVDIKYVLWVIDKYAGAGHLIEEMELVNEDWRANEKEAAYKHGVKRYSNRLNDVPDDVFALLGRAELHFEHGDDDLGVADVSEALKVKPNYVRALNMRAAYFEKKGMFVAAIEDIEASLAVNSEDNPDAHFIRGLLYADNNRYEEAIKEFDKVIEIDYSYYKAYYDRGICYETLGDVDEACRNFELAKSMGDENAEQMYHIGCQFGAW